MPFFKDFGKKNHKGKKGDQTQQSVSAGQPVTEIRQLQAIQEHFCRLNGIVNTPQAAFARLIEESDECNEALATNDLKEVKGELADIVIFALTTANTLTIDLDAEMQRLAEAYPTKNTETLDLMQLQQAQRQYNMLEGTPPSAEQAFQSLTEAILRVKYAMAIHQPQKVSDGLVDIVLCVVDMANYYQIDLARAITDKLSRNYNKYNPAKAQQMREAGMTQAEMLNAQRSQWNRGDDSKFIK